MSENKELKIESYLPVFTGFYNTLLECDCEESLLEDGEEFEDFEWDYKEYNDRVAKSCVNKIGEEIKEFDIKVEFKEVVSPKYYNFSNDRIDVIYTLGENSIEKIFDTLIEDFDEFESYLERNYTSRDGFISFHSNKPFDWFKALLSVDEDELAHKLGAILDYLIGLDMNDLYEHCSNEGEIYIIDRTKIKK